MKNRNILVLCVDHLSEAESLAYCLKVRLRGVDTIANPAELPAGYRENVRVLVAYTGTRSQADLSLLVAQWVPLLHSSTPVLYVSPESLDMPVTLHCSTWEQAHLVERVSQLLRRKRGPRKGFKRESKSTTCGATEFPLDSESSPQAISA